MKEYIGWQDRLWQRAEQQGSVKEKEPVLQRAIWLHLATVLHALSAGFTLSFIFLNIPSSFLPLTFCSLCLFFMSLALLSLVSSHVSAPLPSPPRHYSWPLCLQNSSPLTRSTFAFIITICDLVCASVVSHTRTKKWETIDIAIVQWLQKSLS